jgi:hypothetical protein
MHVYFSTLIRIIGASIHTQTRTYTHLNTKHVYLYVYKHIFACDYNETQQKDTYVYIYKHTIHYVQWHMHMFI